MSNLEELKILLIILGLLFLTIHIVGSFNNGGSKTDISNNNSNNVDNIKKLSSKIEKETLLLENMKIKREETENEIERLKIEGSTDFEKDIQNETKIKRLYLQVRQTDMKISEKEDEIRKLKGELLGMK